MIDPDLIRVDLLRCKRKIYLSYPEGSQARKDFLLASKLSQIGYLSKLIPSELVDKVFDEYKSIVKKEIIRILFTMGMGMSLSIGLLFLHVAYPRNVLLYLWSIGFWVGLFEASRHIKCILDAREKLQPFKKDYDDLMDKIKKLSGELKRLK